MIDRIRENLYLSGIKDITDNELRDNNIGLLKIIFSNETFLVKTERYFKQINNIRYLCNVE